jgi:MGT family glycosyltransferase
MKILFLSMPAHGNVNPTLGLVSELVHQGAEVIYFCSPAFKDKVEGAGAIFKAYAYDLDIFKMKQAPPFPMQLVMQHAELIIDDILAQTQGMKFDYLLHSAAFPFTRVFRALLQVPDVSSLAIFAGLQKFLDEHDGPPPIKMPGVEELLQTYADMRTRIQARYGVEMPKNFMHMIFNKGDINLAYTSKYFAPDDPVYDATFKFVGPPVFERTEDINFPFDALTGKKVLYISLGTVFGNYSTRLYQLFFDAFGDTDFTVVMAAYNVDVATFKIPSNFIVRNYVPQSALLKHTAVAITHAGMNSISDLIFDGVPFISIPLGADQPLLAARAQELGATISLDAATLTAEELRSAVETVLQDPAYKKNMDEIRRSFVEAGGYKKAVEEIFKLKKG